MIPLYYMFLAVLQECVLIGGYRGGRSAGEGWRGNGGKGGREGEGGSGD